ncbi:MAG: ATP-binding protein [Bdellovibrionales bacterium]
MDVPPALKVFANQTSLMQVLVNLIINAIHASGNAGRIEIRAESKNNISYISLRDYGPGVPDELLEKIVQPLFTTKGDEGTGLGLAICKEIIEIEHKGRMNVQNSNDGRTGLVVNIEIPNKELQEVA